MSNDTKRSAERPIILFGPPQSGKSLYALSLVFYGDEARGEEQRLVVLPKDPICASFVDLSLRALRDGNAGSTGSVDKHAFRLYRLPPRPKSGMLSRLRRWRGSPRPDRIASEVVGTIECIDFPGQLLQRGLTEPEHLDPLARAAGLIILISPFHDANGHTYYHQFFQNTFAALARHVRRLSSADRIRLGWEGSKNRLPFPVALCLSQVDRLSEDRQQTAWSPQVEELVREQLGVNPDQLLDWFQLYRCFGISSTGDALRSTGGGEYLVGNPSPRNVLAPLAWILEATRS